MGTRGPLPHKRGVAQPRPGDVVPLHAVPGGLRAKPAPAEDWLETTVEDWNAVFVSELANRISDVDLPALRRLFRARDDLSRLEPILALEPFIDHRGEIRSHPAVMQARQLRRQILELEVQFGLTPLARERLGIEIGRHILTAADVNAMAKGGRTNRPSRKKVMDGEWEFVE